MNTNCVGRFFTVQLESSWKDPWKPARIFFLNQADAIKRKQKIFIAFYTNIRFKELLPFVFFILVFVFTVLVLLWFCWHPLCACAPVFNICIYCYLKRMPPPPLPPSMRKRTRSRLIDLAKNPKLSVDVIRGWCALQGKSYLWMPLLGIARHQSQFSHPCVCERFIYSQDRSTYFPAAE